MKKVIFYFIFIFALGCTSDEELTDEKSLDPIIGKWHYYSYTTTDGETTYDECKQKGYFLFNKDGTGENTPYWERDLNCYEDISKKLTWSLDDSKYIIKIYSQGGYGGVLSFPIIYVHQGEIYENILKINGTLNCIKNPN
ncbi:MAG: lipocalin family protein [Flavobacteriaceae bacterium]|jgi:hypothetical protein